MYLFICAKVLVNLILRYLFAYFNLSIYLEKSIHLDMSSHLNWSSFLNLPTYVDVTTHLKLTVYLGMTHIVHSAWRIVMSPPRISSAAGFKTSVNSLKQPSASSGIPVKLYRILFISINPDNF